jgi:hypothetical protein
MWYSDAEEMTRNPAVNTDACGASPPAVVAGYLTL